MCWQITQKYPKHKLIIWTQIHSIDDSDNVDDVEDVEENQIFENNRCSTPTIDNDPNTNI